MTVQIAYNGKTLDFPRSPYVMSPPEYIRRGTAGTSASGIVETLTSRTDVLVEIAFRQLLRREEPHVTFKRNLEQLEQWAQYGNAWTLALDSTNTVLTTITNTPAAGTSTLSLSSAAGIVAGRNYVVRNEFDVEVVKVASVGGLNVTLTETLNFGYFAGDRFRAEMFWPARLIDNKPLITNINNPLWYDAVLRFMEDVNSL